MAYSIFSLSASDGIVLGSSPTRLLLTHIAQSSGVSVSANQFTVNTTGIYIVTVLMSLSAVGECKEFILELYDETGAAVLGNKQGTVDSIGGGDCIAAIFVMNVTDVANLYSVRLYARGASTAGQKMLHAGYASIAVVGVDVATPSALKQKILAYTNHATPRQITAAETGSLFVNTGAIGGVTFNLPDGVALPVDGGALYYGFINDTAAQTLTIQLAAGNTARAAGLVSSAAGTVVSSAQGDSIWLLNVGNNVWIADKSYLGAWNFT